MRLTCVVAVFVLADVAAAGDRFVGTVRPLVERYCFECHAGAAAKGELDLARFPTETAARAEPHFWLEVERRVAASDMPPRDRPQPSAEERAILVTWIDTALRREIAPDPGRTPPRRLSRSEWRNALRDIFAIDDDLTAAFPKDGSGGAGFDNVADTLFVSPLLMERWLDAAAQAADHVREDVLLAPLGPDVAFDRAAAATVLSYFATLAYRRPPTRDELAALLLDRDAAAGLGVEFTASLRPAIRTLLVSPSFLFRIERDRPGQSHWRVTDLELATRLAAFLWSSVPDRPLLDLALAQRLRDPATLRAEVERMLADRRSIALADDFAAQWLGIRNLLTAAEPDRGRFPAYTDSLRDAMIAEARIFFDALVRERRPLAELVAPSFTFVNEELARHYGIPGVRGDTMRRVILASPARGGVLAFGAVLTATSYPLRTSPVNRGRFVLDELLGDPPPPPPPAVPFLPADEKHEDKLSPRQRLERHRADPSCATCHARMDPLGFALEGYDAVGAARTDIHGAPVDATAELPDGTRFEGIAGLRRVLLGERRDAFVRAFVSKLLAYALGRALEPADGVAVDAIVERTRGRDASVGDVVLAIVESFPFQWRSGPPEER